MDKHAEELRALKDPELLDQLRQLKDRKMMLEADRYFQGSTGNFKKKGELHKVKKLIAQINTILHLRQVKT